MPGRISLALVIHNHQPVGNFGWVIEDVFRAAYEPLIGALERHPGIRLALHYSGPLLDWLRAGHPEILTRIAGLVDRGQVEILGGAYDEPVLVSLPEADRLGQLGLMADELERRFGVRPLGAWLAERVWEPSLPADLARAGYRWTVLDDSHLRAARVAEDAMWGAYTTDDQGHRLTIFGTEQRLRYLVPFGEVDELVEHLRRQATPGGERLGIMGDDGEKFGAWPGTWEHCWGSGRWIDRCFEALEANADWLTTETPSGWLAGHAPRGRIYIPAMSYVEMTEWALPAEEAPRFHVLLDAARARDEPAARFLQGAMWRNFQARYREVNELHKQMLRVSAKVAAMPAGSTRERATEHLYRGQSNDCYWHGLFGGIYLVHLRMATLAELIAAEDLADGTARSSGRPGIATGPGGAARSTAGATLLDLDLDGLDEVLLADEGQVLVIDPAEGAGISSWDLRASRMAVASVLRRRPEAYHAVLLEHELAGAAAATAPTGAGPASIHEIVAEKEPGLGRHLHYDRHERRSGLLRLLPAVPAEEPLGGTGLDQLADSTEEELGDFVDEPFELDAPDGTGVVARRAGSLRPAGAEAIPLTVTKRIRAGGDRLAPWLEETVAIRNDGPATARFELALEWNLDLMGGGGNPAAYYEVDGPDGPGRAPHDGRADLPARDRLVFGNDHEGVRIEVGLQPAGRTSWYAVETISNSEAGFERVYQGSCLLFRWPLELEPAAEREVGARFAVCQERDRAEEEEMVTGPALAATP